jgi:hypothetical protein
MPEGNKTDNDKSGDEKKANNGGRRNNNWRNQNKAGEKFVGAIDDLKGNIYHNSDASQADAFGETNKAIADYAGRTMVYGGDIRSVITNMGQPTILAPVEPATGASLLETELFKESVKEYARRMSKLSENVRILYSIIWGQCTKQLLDKVKNATGFSTTEANLDGLELLKLIRSIVYNYQDELDDYDAVDAAMHRYHNLKQGPYESVSQFLQRFNNTIEVVEHTGGVIGVFPMLEKKIYAARNIVMAGANAATKQQIQDEVKEKYLARSFFMKADKRRYGVLIENTKNS